MQQAGNRVGVIDLGSNTFHLLIVDVENDRFNTVFKERAFIGLAENGIDELSADAMDRGAEALARFKNKLDEYQVPKYKVIGTSALRSANNSVQFTDRIKDSLAIDIEIIDGDREAELIYKGVNLLNESTSECQVIMDVGGGSVEFIIFQSEDIIWSESFDVGLGVLKNEVPLSDPVLDLEIEKIKTFLDEKLESLKEALKDRSIDALIGASGSFEVIQSMNGLEVSSLVMSEVSLEDYHKTADAIIQSTTAEREEMEGLPSSRILLIVVAMILIDKAIDIIQPKRLKISPFALKEGILSELT